MAFQSGSTIRPELGNADYSGFARAAEIQASALSNLGAQIGQGIEKYQKKKKEAADNKASVEFLRKTGVFGNMSDKEIAAGVAGAGGGSNLIAQYSAIEAMKNAQELQAGKVRAGELANQRSQQNLDFAAQNQPLQLQMTEAQIAGLTGAEQRAIDLFPVNKDLLLGQVAQQDQNLAQADVMNPIVTEQALANVAATKQGTAAFQAGVSMAERKQVLSEKLAKQTQEQNEKDYKLKVEELRLKVRNAAQRDPVSKKKLDAAQTFLDDNDLIMVDGAVYEKTGWFGGKAVEVMNPAILNLEGMEDLRRISIDMQSVPSNAASGNFEGYSIQSEGAGGQPVASDSAVSAAALESVVQPKPTGSRFGGFLAGAQDLANAAVERANNESQAMSENFRALPFALSDYFIGEDRPTFEEARLRNLGINPFSRSVDGRLFTR